MSKNYIPCAECGELEDHNLHHDVANPMTGADVHFDECNYEASYEGEETGWVPSMHCHEFEEGCYCACGAASEPSLEEGYIHHGGTLCAHMGVHKLETCFIHQTYREKHFGEKPASEVVCQCGHPRNRHYLYDQDNEESRHRCAACEAGSQAHKFTESTAPVEPVDEGSEQ